MNPLDPNLQTGTIGELLVQIRLLQYDVQAVATHKDTGNDLLATKGDAFRAIQVKTTRTRGRQITFKYRQLMRKKFHILVLVRLSGEDNRVYLDRSDVYLLRRNEVTKSCFQREELEQFRLGADRINELFQ
jgi:hypothetical protein